MSLTIFNLYQKPAEFNIDLFGSSAVAEIFKIETEIK